MNGKIDLNRAGVEELAGLPGIGLRLARRIVAYREEVHPFEEVIELVAVPGISERMVRQIEDQLMVTAAASESSIETVSEAEQEVADRVIAAPETEEAAEALLEEEEVVAETVVLPELEAEPESEAGDQQVTEEEVNAAVAASETEPTTELGELLAEEEPLVEAVAYVEQEPNRAGLPAEPVESATLKEQIEMAEPKQESETVVTPTVAPPPAPPPRNRSLVGGIIGAIFGAILGSVLTLAILNSLNGTLQFATQDQAGELRQELDAGLQGVRGDQSNLSGNLDNLGVQMATMEAGQAAALELVVDNVTDLQATAVALEAEAATIGERLDIVAESAENFDAFLNGLRDLLFDFQGTPPSATPTETATPSPTPVPTKTTVGTATAVPTETETPSPATRTPRPTATPLVTVTTTGDQ